MNDLQERLDKITRRKRKIDGKKLGQLLVSMYEPYVNPAIPMPDTKQFNEAKRKINTKQDYDSYMLYEDIYMAVHTLRLKARDFREQLSASLDLITKTLTALERKELTSLKTTWSPYVMTPEEYSELNDKARQTLTEDKDYSFFILLSDLYHNATMPKSKRSRYPEYLTAELEKLKSISVKGTKYESGLHKRIYQLDGGATVTSLTPYDPEPELEDAMTAIGKERGDNDLILYQIDFEHELLRLIFGGADDIRAYIKSATKTRLNMSDEELEEAVSEIFDNRKDLEPIIRHDNLRHVFDALGLFPHIEDIGQSDELEDDEANMYEALYLLLGGAEGRTMTPKTDTLSQDIKTDFPDLYAALSRYIDEVLTTADLKPLRDYMKLYLSCDDRYSLTVIYRVSLFGLAIQTYEGRGMEIPRDLSDLSDYEHDQSNDGKILNALAYINAYNTLLEVIDKVFGTDLSRFAKVDISFYDEKSYQFNVPLFDLYKYMTLGYQGEELKERREKVRHMFSFGYLRPASYMQPTSKATTDARDKLTYLRNTYNRDDKLRVMETYALYPLYNSIKR